MPEDLTTLKNYLRIDGSEDDQILTLLVGVAKKDLKDSGVAEPAAGSPDERYDLLVMLNVALHYENRDPSIKIEKLNYAYENLILKMKT